MAGKDPLRAWARLRGLLVTDKSNDWSEEIADMDAALGWEG